MTDPVPEVPAAPVAPVAPAAPAATRGDRLLAAARQHRRLLIAIGAPVLALLALVIAFGPITGCVVRQRAARLGVELDFDRVELGWGTLRVERARAGLEGVRGVSVRADVVRVERDGFDISSITGEGITVLAEGSAAERALELGAWSSDHRETFRLRGTLKDVRISFRARPAAQPWLSVTGGGLDSDGKGARFRASAASIAGTALGPVGASWAITQAGMTLAIGKELPAEAPILIELRTAAKAPSMDLSLRPVRLPLLASSLGVAGVPPGGTVLGTANLTFAREGGGHVIDGNGSFQIDGWVPPHPKELNGIVSGKRTTMATKLHVPADRSRVELSALTVAAGSLKLAGSGTIVPEGDHAIAKLTLAGSIACAALARSVASDGLGSLLGGLAGDVAQRSIEGNANVTVAIEADSRDLRAVKMSPTLGVGCSMRFPGFGR